MVGIPLAISSQRSSRSVGVVLGIVLVFIYWMIWLSGVAMANAEIVPVGLALWMGNLIYGVAGLLMLARLDSPRSRDFAAAVLRPFRRLTAWLQSRRSQPNEAAGRDQDIEENGAEAESSSQPFFPITDRYLLSTFLYYFVVMVASFVLIWFVFSFFELLRDMLERDKLGLFIPYIYYLTPFLIYETVPLGVLVATLITFFILAKHHELTAFKACGIKPVSAGDNRSLSFRCY